MALAFCAVPFAFGNLRSGGLGQRLLLGMATLFVAGPYLVAKLVVFATTVWSALPSVR